MSRALARCGKTRWIFSALAAICLAGHAFAQQPNGAGEGPEDYPAGAGRDQTFYACTACHGFKIVAAQAMNREQWEAALALMSSKHGMPPLPDSRRNEILAYLTGAFGPRTTSPGRASPFSPR